AGRERARARPVLRIKGRWSPLRRAADESPLYLFCYVFLTVLSLVFAQIGGYSHPVSPTRSQRFVSQPLSSLSTLTSEPPCGAPVENARWFNEEVQPHHDQLKSFLRKEYPTVRDVDDVLQESYLRLVKVHASRPIGSAKALLFRIASHLAIDFIRREK